MDKIKEQIASIKADFIILDAPQLFESGCDKICHYILGVIADEHIRKNRIICRDNITEDNALIRMRAGLSEEFFEKNCDRIIYNSKDLISLKQTVKTIKEELFALEKNT